MPLNSVICGQLSKFGGNMSGGNSQDLPNKWIADGSWVLCVTEESGIKIRKMPSGIRDNSGEDDPDRSTSFEWLDGADNSPLVFPLADDEQFYYGDYEDILYESDTPGEEDLLLLEYESDEEDTDWLSNLVDGDNGRLMKLFIVHIFSAEEQGTCFKLGSSIFKTVMIFGTVVEVKVNNKKNTLLIDDGTGQIRCFVEDSLNEEFQELGEDCDVSADSPFSGMFEYFKEVAKEDEYVLPTFNNIQVGDRVCVTGNMSTYRDDRYIFIKKLSRPKSINTYISFIEDIYELFERSRYDFAPTINQQFQN